MIISLSSRRGCGRHEADTFPGFAAWRRGTFGLPAGKSCLESLIGSSCGSARAVVIIRRIAGRLSPACDRTVPVVIIRGIAGRPGSAGRLPAAVIIIRGIAGRLGPACDRAVPVVIIGRFPRGRAAVGFVIIWNLSRANETC